jgi:hypothetical protein
MNTHTHTEGPWMYATGEDWDGAHVTDKHGRIVADCQGCDIPGACGEVGTDEAKANARLIAAAPEMLEALREMLSMFGDHEQYDEDSAQVISQTRQVIAKAEGRDA